jgi:hypothetical protein
LTRHRELAYFPHGTQHMAGRAAATCRADETKESTGEACTIVTIEKRGQGVPLEGTATRPDPSAGPTEFDP